MMNRPRINPLSVLFVLALLCYGVYTGVNRSRNGSSVGIDIPGIDGRNSTTRANEGDTTVPVSSGADGNSTWLPPVDRNRAQRSPRTTRSGNTPSRSSRRDATPPSNRPLSNGGSMVNPADIQSGRVVKIVDGDTLELRTVDATLRVRLDGIDAPEAGQPYSRAARELLSQLCYDQTVHVLILGTDRYNRPLGDVYCGDVWVNGELVSAGLAWWYRQYSDSLDLEQLEGVARRQRRGLWADAHPIPPWEYRRSAASSTRSANNRARPVTE